MYPYDNGTYGNETVQCTDGWTYEQNPIQSSIVTEVTKYVTIFLKKLFERSKYKLLKAYL